ncbi:hypothetical protein CAPTEDRAFT_225867 [Capitella teleta]|uniref:N-acetyltransferase domain-containing protein n=1 Tax=Capitella teleta TaxID=283909 RepID=R7TLT7_CAPTE|nr:hypothetical protein CAPTEDRAFT_225867 [Capitella teleta]|eukprot:ELT94629.1 hypothetical protein CAPTEDRAFT_225867 [Capitella teleta]
MPERPADPVHADALKDACRVLLRHCTGDDPIPNVPTVQKNCSHWLPVVMLALYNLQLSGTGKRGYYRWKEHICSFIDKNWQLFFGPSRKKTQTWYGTVAGTLSAGCPIYFSSGTTELGESVSASKCGKKVRPDPSKECFSNLRVEGLRTRGKKTSIEAAIELRAKRDALQEVKELRKEREDPSDIMYDSMNPFAQNHDAASMHLASPTSVLSMQSSASSVATEAPPSEDSQHSSVLPSMLCPKEEDEASHMDCSQSTCSSVVHMAADITDQSSQMSVSSCRSRSSDQWLTERDLMAGEKVPEMLLMAEDEDDYEIDPCALSPFSSGVPSSNGEAHGSDMIDRLLSSYSGKGSPMMFSDMDDGQNRLMITKEDDNARMSFDQSDATEEEYPSTARANFLPLSSCIKEEPRSTSVKSEPIDQTPDALSDDEEEEEVQEAAPPQEHRKRKMATSTETPKKKIVPMSVHSESQLLRKLCELEKYMDSDPAARRLKRKLMIRKVKRDRGLAVSEHHFNLLGSQVSSQHARTKCILDKYQGLRGTSSSFLCKLIGSTSEELHPIKSPYTSRSDSSWVPPHSHPIDYCYVRPQHIPSVNSLCQHFFWPDIDLSECLQYPDFSCVVLFKRLVIGFAFMIPDVKFNEAYISFIFTHPEWRRAGIASFMLYHLIQTCMGKDITLHVAASNPAMLLYQKFGFKPEEFCLNFYDKYLAEDSTDCRHAFLLRLQR